MDLSIVVVNWNTRDLLAACLRSLEQSITAYHQAKAPTFPGSNPSTATGQAVETFVVDNASTDGSASLVRERFPWVRLIKNVENVGFARANNQALQETAGRYVILLNSDTEVYCGALETLVAFMDAHPEAAGCGPRLLNPDGSLQTSCYPMRTPGREFWGLLFLDRLWRRATYPQGRWNLSEPRRVEVIKGACLLLRGEALAEVGLLDEQYFMYTEEMDLCYRLMEAGWQLWWVPQAVVKHHEGASSMRVAEAMYVQLYRSKVQFNRKFGGERRARSYKRLLRLAYTPRWLVTAALGRLSPDMGTRARTYRRLLRELPKL